MRRERPSTTWKLASTWRKYGDCFSQRVSPMGPAKKSLASPPTETSGVAELPLKPVGWACQAFGGKARTSAAMRSASNDRGRRMNSRGSFIQKVGRRASRPRIDSLPFFFHWHEVVLAYPEVQHRGAGDVNR